MTAGERLGELARNLDAVRRSVVAACAAVNRDPGEVTIVAVSKTRPASDVLALRSLGVADFGESYDQEAKAKAVALASMGASIRWHFVGRLQRNKCASIAQYCDVVHAVDRVEVVDALAHAATRAGRVIDVLLQVSLDGDPDRAGAMNADVPLLAARVATATGLMLRGVMAVAPREGDPGRAFAALATVAERVRLEYPGAVVISAGMSSDLEAAIANGSTCVRVGTALFGPREPVHH